MVAFVFIFAPQRQWFFAVPWIDDLAKGPFDKLRVNGCFFNILKLRCSSRICRIKSPFVLSLSKHLLFNNLELLRAHHITLHPLANMVKYRAAIRFFMAGKKLHAFAGRCIHSQGNAHGKPVAGTTSQGRAGQ
jgi:hypothetical protein